MEADKLISSTALARDRREINQESSMEEAVDGHGHAEQSVFQRRQQEKQTSSLDEDYQAVAELLRKLDAQSAAFSSKMKQIVESAPAYDGLAALWGEQADAIRPENLETGTLSTAEHSSTGIDHIIDDETIDDSNDQILLL